MTIHYESNCGQYVQHSDGRPVGRPLDEIAIAYEICQADGSVIRHKTGSRDTVHQWIDKTKDQLHANGGALGKEMADALKLYIGRPDIRTLNEAILGNQQALKNIVCLDLVVDVQARVVTERDDGSIMKSELHAVDVQELAQEPIRSFRRPARP